MSLKTLQAEDRFIYYALLISCIVHALILAVSFILFPRHLKAQLKNVEIVYHSQNKPKSIETAKIQNVGQLKETRKSPLEPDTRLAEKQLMKSTMGRDALRQAEKLEVPEKQSVRIPDIVEKRSISVPMLSSGKINNPQYLTYNDRIRNKIRNRAYFYIDDPKFQAGEVYMTFVVASDGSLRDLKVIPERSRANEYLCEVGLRSIKESAPFPPFPPELKYPELSFNVVISFEVDQ